MSPVLIGPNKKYLFKIVSQTAILGLILFGAMRWVMNLIRQNESGQPLENPGWILIILYFLGLFSWTALLIHHYLRLHYEIHEDKVIMHVGVITVTMKQIPVRSITSIVVKRGPFDRLFGLGTLEIQTVGTLGERATHESLSGLSNFREAYLQIAKALRIDR
jgi:uncharacterized membrane protein YdbT with pleckstrin-like domain